MYCRKCGCNQWHSKEIVKERTIIKKPLWKGWLFFAIGITPVMIGGFILTLLKMEAPWWTVFITMPCLGFVIASFFYFKTRKKRVKERFIECTCIQCGYIEYTLKETNI